MGCAAALALLAGCSSSGDTASPGTTAGGPPYAVEVQRCGSDGRFVPDGSGTSVFEADGTVTNRSDEANRYVVQIRLYDEATDIPYVYVLAGDPVDVAAGGTGTWTVRESAPTEGGAGALGLSTAAPTGSFRCDVASVDVVRAS